MKQLDDLLVVQGHDTTIAQLIHKRASLPELEKRDAAYQRLETIASERSPLAQERENIRVEQTSIEGEVTMLVAKIERENGKLYNGTVTGVKELQALQDEIASLKRHQVKLEDDVIEQMEAAEPIDEALQALAAREEKTNAALTQLLSEIAALEAGIDAELDVERSKRAEAAVGIDPELLQRFETISADTGGVGIAKYSGGVCNGCHMKMSAMEADRLKKAAPDEILTCDSCERILVR